MTPRAARAPWLAALAGLAVSLAAFYPGYMSWDSAYQWWQARHDQFDATHPPLMAMIWQLTDRVLPGPGGLLLLQLGLIWSALAAFAAALPWRPWQQALLVLGLGFWPPLFGLSAFLWKDLWTLAAFAWALALLASDLRAPARRWRLLALLALTLACAFRHNAITGALPLLAWLAWRETRGGPRDPRWAAPLLTLALAAGTWLLAGLPNRDPRVQPVDSVWSVVTLWDAAAVSLAENRLVYPPELVDPSLTLDELRANFVDYSNGTVYHTGKLRHSFGNPYSDTQRQALRQLAWSLPTEHPRAYFAHRLRVAELLYGWDRAGLPDGQVMWHVLHGYGDNPPLDVPRPAFQARVASTLLSWVDTPLYAGWLYLLAAAAAMAYGLRRACASPWAGLGAAAAASSLAYALPLALASGSAEFRYLAWPLLAALSALALVATPRAPGNAPAPAPPP